MPQDQAEVVFSAEDREILRSWKQQYAEVSNLTTAINRLNATFAAGAAKSQDASGRLTGKLKDGASATQQWQGAIGKWASTASMSYLAVDQALSRTIGLIKDAKQAYEDFQKESAAATLERSDSFTKYRVQAGINSEFEGEAAKKAINAAAYGSATTIAQADEAAAYLASSGFSRAEIEGGGAARETLVGLQAQGAIGKDTNIAELSKGLSKFMGANQIPKTGENVRDIMEAMQALKETNIKIEDLVRYSAEAGTIKELGRVPWKDQLAILSTFLDTMEPRIADTSIRLSIQELATLGASKSKTRSLAKLGLKPTDVDLIGETYVEAMEKIGTGLERVPEVQRAGVLRDIFGSDAMRGIITATQEDFAGKVRQRRAATDDDSILARDMDTILGSQAAMQRREEVNKTIAKGNYTTANTELARTTLDTELTNLVNEGKMAPWVKSLKEWQFSISKFGGYSDEEALRNATGSGGMARLNYAADSPIASYLPDPLGLRQGVYAGDRAVERFNQNRYDAPAPSGFFERQAARSAFSRITQPHTAIDDLIEGMKDVIRDTFTKPQKLTVESGNVQRPATKTVKGVL